MNSKKLSIHNGANGQLIKTLHHEIINFLVILNNTIRPKVMIPG
jgi:hypothetical protein